VNRRDFLTGTMGATLLAAVPADLLAQTARPPSDNSWDAGRVRHLLPTVSDTRILLKASFREPLRAAPTLRVGGSSVRGQMNDTAGEYWQFDAARLEPGRRYTLSIRRAGGAQLCEPWDLSTFPGPDARPERFRVAFFTCAGGHDALGYLPTGTRSRLLRRALSLQPDAVVANGDHVYWDLRPAPGVKRATGVSPDAIKAAGTFNRSALVFGDRNETVLKLAAGPQITPVYGTDFRSTPVFFLQDDHDHYDNDEAGADLVTYPPSWFMMQLARATQRLYYPEFLPDLHRPAGLPWSSAGDRNPGLSESFGTIRFGRLVEINLYDVRRTLTLAGPSAVLVDPEVEAWLHARAASTEVTHLVHVPSSPPGWSAGKWGDWYPDVLGADGKLTTAKPKAFWQEGWLKQHDRIMASLGSMKGRAALVISGDLHAIGMGQMRRSGALSFERHPITVVLAGPIGTDPGGFPSSARGVGASPPTHLDMQQVIPPVEQHGFTLADFLPDRTVLQFFKWDRNTQPRDAIDDLTSFQTAVLPRPS
jgi:hypothetical protein